MKGSGQRKGLLSLGRLQSGNVRLAQVGRSPQAVCFGGGAVVECRAPESQEEARM